MKKIICHSCGKTKSEDDFSWRKLNVTRHTICRECQKVRSNKHYQDNKSSYAARNKRSDEERLPIIRSAVYDYLKSHPCVDCGENDPVVLEFDHVRGKDMNVSSMIQQRYSLAKIMLEISKCDVRCANCHRRRTAERSSWWKLASNAPLA